MHRKNSVFIAATGQHVGKTTTCLGILDGLKRRYGRVGFIKPVGQQHVSVEPHVKVDKDVVLFKRRFGLPAAWEDMSPVIIPAGYTRDFLDGKISEEGNREKILKAFKTIYDANDYTVVEGTGHVGVGTIVNMNNARVAAELGLDMVVVSQGGLGSAHDELALNIAMCRDYGVRIKGAILNRVLDSKRDMIIEYFTKSLKKWDIPLIGTIPYNEFLNTPSIRDFVNLFDTKLISGEEHDYRHFKHTRLVAGSMQTFVMDMAPNELVITPASREDIIYAVLEKHRSSLENDGIDFKGGLILTDRHPPKKELIDAIKKVDIPVLYAPVDSYAAMKMITGNTAKMRIEDKLKVDEAIRLVEENLNFELLTR